MTVLVLLAVALLGPGGMSAARAEAPSGQMTLVYNISIVPRWFDPAEHVAAVEIVDPHRVRFRLKRPWPDFMTFYGSPATSVKLVLELANPGGYGPRVVESAIGLIPYMSSSAPYEELRLKGT